MKHPFFYVERKNDVVNVVDLDFEIKGNFEFVSPYLENRLVSSWRTNVKSAVKFANDKSRDGALFFFDVEVNAVKTYRLLCSDATSAFLAGLEENSSCERKDYIYSLYNMSDSFRALTFHRRLEAFREENIDVESRRAFISVSEKAKAIRLSTVGISPPGYFNWSRSYGIYTADIKHLEETIQFVRLSDIQPTRKFVPYDIAEGLCVPPPDVPAELVDRAIRRKEIGFKK